MVLHETRRGRPQTQAGLGPWTEFFLSNYVNDLANASKPDKPDKSVIFVGITDGTSNTVLVGHGNISTLDYAAVGGVVGSHNIYAGGIRHGTRGIGLGEGAAAQSQPREVLARPAEPENRRAGAGRTRMVH